MRIGHAAPWGRDTYNGARTRLRALPGERILPALLATAIAIHVGALASLHFGYLDFLFNDAENRLGRGADFFAVYGSGQNFLHGVSVYGPITQGADGVPYAYPFRYLPSVGFSFGALLNALRPWPAYWSWAGFNEALLLINVVLTWRAAPNRALAIIGASMWLVYSPFYVELFMGQFNFFMASVLFWLGLSLLADRRAVLFGSWTASLLAKTNSLILLPLAWRTGWLRLALAGIAFAALLNLPYFLLVHGSWHSWAGNFDFLSSKPPTVPHAGNLGLSSFEALLRAEPRAGSLGDAARFAGGLPWDAAFIAVSLLATARAASRQVVPLLALWLCVYFLVFDEVWEHQYVMLLPAVVLLTLFDARLRIWAIAAFVLLALPTPYALLHAGAPRGVNYQYVDPQLYWSSAEVYLYHLSKALPTLLLWCVCAWSLLRRVGTPTAPDLVAVSS